MLIVKLEQNKSRRQLFIVGQFVNIDRDEIIKSAVYALLEGLGPA